MSYSTQDLDRVCINNSVSSMSNQPLLSNPLPFSEMVSFSSTPIAGHNPLLDSAARLFSILNRCDSSSKKVQLSLLHHDLKQEIKIFETRAKQHYAQDESILECLPVLMYWMALTLDQVVSSQSWADCGRWDPFQIALTVVDQPILPEHVVIILERMMREPNLYIDVLEFFYMCLNLGFSSPAFIENRYFNSMDISFLLEGLHRSITMVREQHRDRVGEMPFTALSSRSISKKWMPQGVRRMAVVSVACVLGAVCVFFQLNHTVSPAPQFQLALAESSYLSRDQISVKVMV